MKKIIMILGFVGCMNQQGQTFKPAITPEQQEALGYYLPYSVSNPLHPEDFEKEYYVTLEMTRQCTECETRYQIMPSLINDQIEITCKDSTLYTQPFRIEKDTFIKIITCVKGTEKHSHMAIGYFKKKIPTNSN